MNYESNITILNSNNKISYDLYSLITVKAINAMEKISGFFNVSDIDVTITSAYGEKIPTGIGGYSLNPFRVEILLDCERKDLASIVEEELASVLAHEIHHCARTRIYGVEETLADNIITEGLACFFERNFNGGNPPSFLKEMNDKRWMDIYSEMNKMLKEDSFCFETYFLGKDESQYAKYSGYLVGYNLVKLKANELNLNDSQLLKLSVEDFLI
ncbi:DUF2268 domain-containing putative Zn-dependent protease [Vibrio alginolyticus]|uniref:DUF2268 domain-containing putative Zn-dependent protease n=1 Tax=Vibrio alginolyticus TaxID=663 RepID=UPI002119F875|nr:DUF2268 domain-containing putative Zn-dependent protease [Vibrio alginolyticus]MCQ9090934.1 hypothetical protein [Vibrio alginolyticus]